jgi:uncharacterized delta-60 repeat protein
MTKSWFADLVIGILFLTAPLGAHAQSELDTTFNQTGMVVTRLNGFTMYGRNALVQPGNKIVLFGNGQLGGGSIRFFLLLVRYNENGTVDTSFGTGGFVQAEIGQYSGPGQAILQPDGKILISGKRAASPGSASVLMRYNSDGSPDTSFNGTGKVELFTSGTYYTGAQAICLQPDGKIAVTGSATNIPGPAAHQFTARLNPDGSLISVYGHTERIDKAPLGEDRATTYPAAMACIADGSFYTVGSTSNFPETPIGQLKKYRSDGTPDPAFGSNGILNFDGTRELTDIRIQPDGKIVMAGTTVPYTYFVERTDGMGSPDSLFGVNGVAAVPAATGLELYSNGRIAVSGTTPQSRVSASRLKNDGTIDNSFSGDGSFEFGATPNSFDRVQAVTIDPRGRMIISGWTTQDTNTYSFFISRLSYGPVSISGRVFSPTGRPISNAVVSISYNGTVISTARTSSFGYYSLSGITDLGVYTISVTGKGYTFDPRTITLQDDLVDFDIFASQ